MTLLDLPESEGGHLLDVESPLPGEGEGEASGGTKSTPVDEEVVSLAEVFRPLLATALATAGAGLVIGGIFGSWTARAIGLAAAAIGPAWTFLSLRSRNRALTQAALLPVLLVLGVASVVAAGKNPGELGHLISDAIASGRNFRPPVPFDAGWRPMLIFVIGLLGFGAAAVATTFGRPRLGVAMPVPIIALAAISQPDNAAFVAGISAFLPVLAGLAVLLTDDDERAVGREFELKRAARGGAAMAVLLALLIGINSASFLFPSPVYNPDDKPQKPRAIPLSAAADRVLFEVKTDSTITGPWRSGALDVYADSAFQSVPSSSRLKPLPASGAVGGLRTGVTPVEVTITVRDLGDSPVLPTLAGTTSVAFDAPIHVQIDPRYETLRIPSGRAPSALSYTLRLPPYATDDQLAVAKPGSGAAFKDNLAVPKPPPVVQQLLETAPQNPWQRLDLLRQTLLDRVVAAGPGTPVEITPARVAEILAEPVPGAGGAAPKGNEASPYEIVATEALLARWAGIPSRIGFGYDGLNTEGGVLTVRPRNSAQWLEVNFAGYGWVPLIGKPDEAKTSLDPDPVTNFTPDVLASKDVAVQVFIVYERKDIGQLYERLRRLLFLVAPWAALALGGYVTSPGLAKLLRARRRRQWAAARGPRAQIAVEYAQLRDLAIDLNVGDDYDSPLEYLGRVTPDEEHEELAWLVSRTVYSDLADSVTEQDVITAEELSKSLRRRMARAQPASVQVLAFISRASIELPFTAEIPNVRVVRVGPYVRRAAAVVARHLRAVVNALRSRVPRPLRLGGLRR